MNVYSRFMGVIQEIHRLFFRKQVPGRMPDRKLLRHRNDSVVMSLYIQAVV